LLVGKKTETPPITQSSQPGRRRSSELKTGREGGEGIGGTKRKRGNLFLKGKMGMPSG